ncbi:hypothetical protein SHAM105786_10700 [Shewanella amazonensis]
MKLKGLLLIDTPIPLEAAEGVGENGVARHGSRSSDR